MQKVGNHAKRHGRQVIWERVHKQKGEKPKMESRAEKLEPGAETSWLVSSLQKFLRNLSCVIRERTANHPWDSTHPLFLMFLQRKTIPPQQPKFLFTWKERRRKFFIYLGQLTVEVSDTDILSLFEATIPSEKVLWKDKGKCQCGKCQNKTRQTLVWYSG